MVRKILCGGVLAVLGCAVAVGAADLVAPSPVSPGSGQQVETVPGSWPTFSWGAVAGAAGYRLVVYELTAEGELGRAVIRRALAAGASSWSPSLRQGLEPGASYAWTVGAVARKGKMLWSEPALFRVAPGPGERELEEALAVVQRYWVLQGDGAGEVGSKSADPSARQPESRPEAGVSTPHTRAPASTELSVEGNVDAGSFSGSGALLTALDPANLSLGTAAIDISGTAANVTGTVGIGQGGTGATTASAACANLGAATEASLVAHVSGSDHDGRYYTESELQTSDSAAVHWDNLTSLPTTTKGDLLVEDGANVVALTVGTNGQVLVADSTASEGVAWATVATSSRVCTAPALVPRTGQTTTDLPGDDGNLQRGVVWPDPRFTDNSDETVTDNLTGLIWLKKANCFGTETWADALAAALGLQDTGTPETTDDCGLSDGSLPGNWRLPNVRELHSLIDFGQNSPALPSGHPFSGVQSSYYWSSTPYAFGTTYAWFVNFGYGDVFNDFKVNSHDVWPVRGGQ